VALSALRVKGARDDITLFAQKDGSSDQEPTAVFYEPELAQVVIGLWVMMWAALNMLSLTY